VCTHDSGAKTGDPIPARRNTSHVGTWPFNVSFARGCLRGPCNARYHGAHQLSHVWIKGDNKTRRALEQYLLCRTVLYCIMKLHLAPWKAATTRYSNNQESMCIGLGRSSCDLPPGDICFYFMCQRLRTVCVAAVELLPNANNLGHWTCWSDTSNTAKVP
jgi:hypothetical protein